MEETSIKLAGNFAKSIYGALLKSGLEHALAIEHKLPEWIVKMPGMSGRKYRYLINEMLGNLTDPRYCEVGSWAGSTACSAMWGNTLRVICIDNWSEFDGPKAHFESNVARVRTDKIDFSFIESDFRKVDWAKLPKSNVYLFDGPHTESDQYDGIVIAQPALDAQYVLIVDDYNWPEVRNGTLRAINDLNLQVECSIEIRTTQDNTYPFSLSNVTMPESDWHNGYFIAVVGKG